MTPEEITEMESLRQRLAAVVEENLSHKARIRELEDAETKAGEYCGHSRHTLKDRWPQAVASALVSMKEGRERAVKSYDDVMSYLATLLEIPHSASTAMMLAIAIARWTERPVRDIAYKLQRLIG